MSRVGKLPIAIPQGVEAKLEGENAIVIKKGNREVKHNFGDTVKVEIADNLIKVTRVAEKCKTGMYVGLHRNLINNLVQGLANDFQEKLQLSGTGYKASVLKNMLILSLGYSHDIFYAFPEDVAIQVDPKTGEITIGGANKELVGQITSEIVAFRKPEPYKGHGVIRNGAKLLRKEGKKK